MQAIRFRAVLGVEVECRDHTVKVSTRIYDEATGGCIASGQDQDKVRIHYDEIVGTPQ